MAAMLASTVRLSPVESKVNDPPELIVNVALFPESVNFPDKVALAVEESVKSEAFVPPVSVRFLRAVVLVPVIVFARFPEKVSVPEFALNVPLLEKLPVRFKLVPALNVPVFVKVGAVVPLIVKVVPAVKVPLLENDAEAPVIETVLAPENVPLLVSDPIIVRVLGEVKVHVLLTVILP
jgi:hypothetical protein